MKKKVESVNSFYDSIAVDYEDYMTDSDKKIRKKVSDLFKINVPFGYVLDFGGGTGLDLRWLLEEKYHVFFLEPSVNMRAIAKNRFSITPKNISPAFIEKNMNIEDWTNENLPFNEKVDGVLANFAVLNCMKDIKIFFEKMSLVTGGNSHIIASVIDPRLRNIVRHYSILGSLNMFLRGKLRILNQHKGVYHDTYIHSVKSIKAASHKYFRLNSIVQSEISNFTILILSKR